MLFAAFSVPTWLAVRSLVDDIMAQWTVRYVEQQVRYDKIRVMRPIVREITVARQLASSAAIIDFARDPGNATLQARAIGDMETLRYSFSDQSYFVVLLNGGQYFHNNRQGEYTGRQFRYTVRPDAPKDSWFYDQIAQRRDLHLNVNIDRSLGVTKLWINVLIRDRDEVLGIAGTGFDLTEFIENVVEPGTTGLTRVLIDGAGAIQLYRDQSLIDFSSISKSSDEQSTIEAIFDQPSDIAAIRAGMKELRASSDLVKAIPAEMAGRRYLIGLTRLESLDWYEMTLMDLAVLMPFSQYKAVLVVYVFLMAFMLLLFSLAMNYYVIRPLGRLDRAMADFEQGQQVPADLADSGTGEVRSLMNRFSALAEAVTESRRDLESKIRQRTLDLDHLTKVDALTGSLNRRGMTERLEAEIVRSAREGGQFGILIIDIDLFKNINDTYGHIVGDQVLRTLAGLIAGEVRPYDFTSRWGGDEFLVLVSSADRATLDSLGERLCAKASSCADVMGDDGQYIAFSVSIGGQLSQSGSSLNDILSQADQALYDAKREERGTYRAARPDDRQ